MSTEQELKELMGLVGALAQDTALFMGNIVQISKVETSAQALEDRLRALLAELDAAREDARKNKVDAECFRWWVHEAEANPSLVAKAISHCITEDDYRQVICGAMEAKNAVIRIAREADEGHAGMECEQFGGGIVSVSTLERFAALVAAEEREACAKVCESRYMGDNNREDVEAKACAAAIRARGVQPKD